MSALSREGSGIPASASGVTMANVIISGFSKGSKDLRDDLPPEISMEMVDMDNNPVPSSESNAELREYHKNLTYVKRIDALFCFKYLVVYIAALMSFAHGANDTANSTATFSAVYTVYEDGLSQCDAGTEIWIMVIAGSCSSLGTILLGYKVLIIHYILHIICSIRYILCRITNNAAACNMIMKVIETVGKGITELDFHKAFCANIAAVVAVVVSTIFKVS
jgi:phosphate/sulfate permease